VIAKPSLTQSLSNDHAHGLTVVNY